MGIKIEDIENLARSRLEEADILFMSEKYDAANYLCGYAIELKLKARICIALSWEEFPSGNNDFKGLASFKTHDLGILLKLSGKEKDVKRDYFSDWSLIAQWNPEKRYEPIGTIQQNDVRTVIDAAKKLMEIL